jgi:Family of unknown function (DUF6510)
MNPSMNHLDGNAAAGELSQIFGVDITSAVGQCANCGAKRPFAEAHLYMRCPGLIARCALCEHVLLRFANVRGRIFLDLRGMAYLRVEVAQEQETSN